MSLTLYLQHDGAGAWEVEHAPPARVAAAEGQAQNPQLQARLPHLMTPLTFAAGLILLAGTYGWIGWASATAEQRMGAHAVGQCFRPPAATPTLGTFPNPQHS